MGFAELVIGAATSGQTGSTHPTRWRHSGSAREGSELRRCRQCHPDERSDVRSSQLLVPYVAPFLPAAARRCTSAAPFAWL